MGGHDASLVGSAAAKFTIEIFNLPETCEESIQKLFIQRLVPQWKVDNPHFGSCKRALLFPYGKIDPDFEIICNKLNLSIELQKGRGGFPYEFTLFQDPDGCEVEFSWGLRCRDLDSVSLFPRNDWASYSKDYLQRKVQKSTKVSSKKWDTFTVAGAEVIWNENVVNSNLLSSSDSESDKSSPASSRGPSPNAEKLFVPSKSHDSALSGVNLNQAVLNTAPASRPLLGGHMKDYSQLAVYSSATQLSPVKGLVSASFSSQRSSPTSVYLSSPVSKQAYTSASLTPPSSLSQHIPSQHMAALHGGMYFSSGSYINQPSAPISSGSHTSNAYVSSAPGMSVDLPFTLKDGLAATYRDLNSAVPLMA